MEDQTLMWLDQKADYQIVVINHIMPCKFQCFATLKASKQVFGQSTYWNQYTWTHELHDSWFYLLKFIEIYVE
jgi:hypothetical protein